MHTSELFGQIKKNVIAYLPDAQVWVFGSHARGDFNKHSDVDVMIVTPQNIPLQQKMQLEVSLSKLLVTNLKMPFDVLLYSQEEIRSKKNSKGNIVYHALKDAIVL